VPGEAGRQLTGVQGCEGVEGQGVELRFGVAEGLGQVHRQPQEPQRLPRAPLPIAHAGEPAGRYRVQGLVAAGLGQRRLQQLRGPVEVAARAV
jgi:hypothetical protein